MSQSPLPAIIVSTFYMHPFLFVLIQTTRNCVILCSAGGQALVSVKLKELISFIPNHSMLQAFYLGSLSFPVEFSSFFLSYPKLCAYFPSSLSPVYRGFEISIL